jgi:hypothetical protein
MFAVNYKPGGENDPILSYCDQKIGNNIGRGLMRRFFLPRLAVMEHGKLYRTPLHLTAIDVTNWLHREAIILRGAEYYLIGFEKFTPLMEQTTECTLWKYVSPTEKNLAACYPSANSLAGGNLSTDDVKYAPLLLLTTDLPR